MQSVLDFSKTWVLRRAQEFPAPLCNSCSIPMWVLKRDDGPQGWNRVGYACPQCGESVRHRRRNAGEQGSAVAH